jgi:hypothetical protein
MLSTPAGFLNLSASWVSLAQHEPHAQRQQLHPEQGAHNLDQVDFQRDVSRH